MNRILEACAHAFEGDALHNWIEETFDDQTLRLSIRDTPAAQVEYLLWIDLATVAPCVQRTSSARISRPGIESARACGLRVRLRFAGSHPSFGHPARRRSCPATRATAILKRTLIEQITGGMRCQMVLLGIMIQMLDAIREIETRHPPA